MNRIKELRNEVGVSQQALATAAGLSMSIVYRAEQGANVTVATLTALAEGLTTLGRPTSASELLDEVPA